MVSSLKSARICMPRATIRLFLIAGVVSGTLSAITSLTSFGLFGPGVLFGLALSISLDRTFSAWSEFESFLLTAGSMLAYWVAIAAIALMMEIPGIPGGIGTSLIPGFCAGATGSLLVALAIKALIPVPFGRAEVIRIAMIGGALGSVYMLVASLGSMFDSSWSRILGWIFSYALWQCGVSTAIARSLCSLPTTQKASAKGSRFSRDDQDPFPPPV